MAPPLGELARQRLRGLERNNMLQIPELPVSYTHLGAFDFDDLIYQTVILLSEHEDVREFYQNKYKYLLVDEYQDTSVAQFRLVSLLTGPEKNICVVGDDDQSIYRFRGATIENILNFERIYKGTKTCLLYTSRCV